ncbi:hypothetical protein A5792_20830 [Mycolicibacterium peregrinum]|uniref:GmrSD restriction endonucleases N-terminal domain-containing protein n=2 Tax=Mycolicibacterium peregrinum TaxID=43304 RepID=A0A1A0R4A3_MYCPR|nr:hypothetical protein A5792_20830 [Mycolicibacterium peregrinum]
MSIGEVLSLYREGDIEIHPEFQRIFRWNDDQKSRLIESILLGIPIPPIFVSQRPDGVWDVIDGVQRISTILEFTGEYRDEEQVIQPPLTLRKGEYLTELDGYTYLSPEDGADTNSFDDALRRDFKRSKLDFSIITKESDQNAKYDLFQRLNSGSILSPQEARNCLMVMINRTFFHTITELSSNEYFTSCSPLTERQEEESYPNELVLRFFCQGEFSGGITELQKEYGEYLTDWMRTAAEREIPLNGQLFNDTFQLLHDALGEDVFRRFDGDRHLGPFSISAFEFVTTGVAHNLSDWKHRGSEDLRTRVRSIWKAPEFRSNSGTGVSPRRRVPRIIAASREYFGSN